MGVGTSIEAASKSFSLSFTSDSAASSFSSVVLVTPDSRTSVLIDALLGVRVSDDTFVIS